MEKKKGVSYIMYIEPDFLDSIDKDYEIPTVELKGWKINCERDEKGRPVQKKGYAKVYIFMAMRYRLEDKKTIRICFNVINNDTDLYEKVTMDIPRNIIKLFPCNQDYKYILIKDHREDLLLEKEIW